MTQSQASITLSQIGRKALFMIGAKNIVFGENGLVFQIRGCKQYNYIRIQLDPMDYYNMEFIKIHNCKEIRNDRHEGVYCDMLKDVIEEHTGLATRL